MGLMGSACPGKQSMCHCQPHLFPSFVFSSGFGLWEGDLAWDLPVSHKLLVTGIFLWNEVSWVRPGPGCWLKMGSRIPCFMGDASEMCSVWSWTTTT